MSKKEQCKEIMLKLFGPASAEKVELMGEDNCIEECKKLTAFTLGEEAAKVFDEVY